MANLRVSRAQFNKLPTATGGIARAAYARAMQARLDLDLLLKQAGLTSRQIRNTYLRIDVKKQIRFLNLVANMLSDETLGFRPWCEYTGILLAGGCYPSVSSWCIAALKHRPNSRRSLAAMSNSERILMKSPIRDQRRACPASTLTTISMHFSKGTATMRWLNGAHWQNHGV